jgi:low temperature requirement protein LtrA
VTAPLPDEGPVARVSTLELFFDLVFVFAVTQLAYLVKEARAPADYLRAVLVLAVVWWMYGGYAWLTSNLGTQRFGHRLLLLTGMAAFLVLAIRVPAIAGRHGVMLGLAYLVIVLVHAALFAQAPNSSARAILFVLPFNLVISGFLVASGLVPAAWSTPCWIGAGLTIALSTVMRSERGFELSPAHFVERHGSVVLVALGESVVSVGVGAGELPVGLRLIAAVVLGFALVAVLWWSYFDRDAAAAEEALRRMAGPERAQRAFHAYLHAHLVILTGIIVAAAGMHGLVASLGGQTGREPAYLLSGGVALYFVGDALFRRTLRIGVAWPRLVSAGAAIATTPLALLFGGLTQLAALVVVLAATLPLATRDDARADAKAPAG